MVDLRPISLCNVRYKIASKVLANRLKKVIDEIISEEQSAFIPGRIISDNIMISFEIIHYMKRKTQGKEGWMALKLDMSKAYDRVEWSYIRAMLGKLGFNSSVINLFMQCVTTARYKITHSGREFGDIIPQRGLRQGDPMSSYLFLVCMEGLSSIIKSYENRGLIKGIKVARGAPSVSHMFFADDSYIYCHATRDEAVQVMEILSIFEKASGQKINTGKSSVFFSRNVQQDVKDEILQVLGFHEADSNTQYLGLPSCIGRSKTAVLGYLKDRVSSRIQSWDGNLLNKSGKEVLIKTVTQANPTYAMSVFLLPNEMCKDMEKLMCKYWWKSGKKEKSIHWMSWERMSVSKMYGGLGFRNLHEFNVALLGKQGWRLVTNPTSLVARMFKAKYYPNDSFLSAKLGANPSFVWRSILAAQNILSQGMGCRVGDGKSISIVNDPWLPSSDSPYVVTESEAIQNQKVSSLMLPDVRRWDEDLVRDIFVPRDANIILATPLSEANSDIWYWRKENNGIFSIKTAYNLIQEAKPVLNHYNNPCFWKRTWNLHIPPKVKNFMWRAITGCLPTKDMLHLKKVSINVICSLCNSEIETTSHIFLECSFAKSCWQVAGVGLDEAVYTSFQEWVLNVFNGWDADKRQRGAMLCWIIWKCRNDLIWNQKCLKAQEAANSARVALSQWMEAQDKFFDRSWSMLNQNDGDERWTLPTENQTKVNTDAAVFVSFNRYSYAFAARNYKGELLEARSKCNEGTISPDCAEIMGIREALSWIKAKEMENVVVETDCLVAVQAIRSEAAMISYFGSLVQECRELLRYAKDKGVILRFVKRSANNLAHALASCSYSVADRVWKANEAYPEIILVLKNDLI
ncbi:hypothetical protein DCAR_0206908 [Daucus carota subsp. sativus]|uniref:Reverse transcriptase domain-containing protein n=1 Tax=Daucus carota subsp. sativus TaxID=79200 RepID=A0AAF1AP42_DAUCS|nr:hypothetical protein DCAR_0206908 [Daucus carota subsp. sativus]